MMRLTLMLTRLIVGRKMNSAASVASVRASLQPALPGLVEPVNANRRATASTWVSSGAVMPRCRGSANSMRARRDLSSARISGNIERSVARTMALKLPLSSPR